MTRLTYSIIVERSRGRGDATQTRDITTPALQNLIRKHLGHQILPLSDLRTVLQTVGLLGKENVTMIMRRFHNLWSSSPIFNVHPVALVRLGALGTWV